MVYMMDEVFVHRYAYPGKDRSKKQMPGLRSAKGMICLRVNLHSLYIIAVRTYTRVSLFLSK